MWQLVLKWIEFLNGKTLNCSNHLIIYKSWSVDTYLLHEVHVLELWLVAQHGLQHV